MICIFWVAIFAFMHQSLALQVKLKIPIKCANPAWQISSIAQYNIAYLWTKGRPIDNWKYTKNRQKVLTTFEMCRDIQYSTSVSIPMFFIPYSQTRYHDISIQKEVCIKGNMMEQFQENVQIHNVPFIQNMTIHMQGRILKSQLYLDSDVDIIIPWYLVLVREQIIQHITKSLQEYFELVAHDTCLTVLLPRRRLKMHTT